MRLMAVASRYYGQALSALILDRPRRGFGGYACKAFELALHFSGTDINQITRSILMATSPGCNSFAPTGAQ